jgi:hypothetical protein
LVAVTVPPDGEMVAFHALVTCCPDGNVQRRFQPLMGSPRLVTETLATKPPPHWEALV